MSTKPFTEFTFIIPHKKAFQSNANWLFADWVDSIMNKFEHVLDGRSTVRSKLKKFKHVSGLCTEEEAMALYRRGWALNRDSPISCGHTHTTENSTTQLTGGKSMGFIGCIFRSAQDKT